MISTCYKVVRQEEEAKQTAAAAGEPGEDQLDRNEYNRRRSTDAVS